MNVPLHGLFTQYSLNTGTCQELFKGLETQQSARLVVRALIELAF